MKTILKAWRELNIVAGLTGLALQASAVFADPMSEPAFLIGSALFFGSLVSSIARDLLFPRSTALLDSIEQ